MTKNDETQDKFYHGRISILQKKRGLRFSLDAPLLADFIRTQKGDELLELGAGNGVISLLLSFKPFKHITALEIQKSLFELAQKNISLNKLEHKITVIQTDLRKYKAAEKFDVIFSNPPYYEIIAGRMSKSREKAVAKHELKCTIFDIMGKTSELLKKDGRAYFIYKEKRRKDFINALEERGLNIKLERCVLPHSDRESNFFLTECVFSREKKVVLQPLILYDEDGNYSTEAQEIFKGRSHV